MSLIEIEKQKRKIEYDKRTNDLQLEIGNLVLLKNDSGHKLDNQYLGPYKVIEIGDKKQYHNRFRKK